MLEYINADFVKTARAKGQKESVVIYRHIFQNALIPIITIAGGTFGLLLGGAIMLEQVFAIPGLGKYMVDAIKANNYPAVRGGVLYLAVVQSIVNLLIDLIYAFIDPRIKASFKSGGRKRVRQVKQA
jgi:peptide/nickel transport system permease protein